MQHLSPSSSEQNAVMQSVDLVWSGLRRFGWAGGVAATLGVGYYFQEQQQKLDRALCDEEARQLILSHAKRLDVVLGPGWKKKAPPEDSEKVSAVARVARRVRAIFQSKSTQTAKKSTRGPRKEMPP